jgi:hypothetical protein
MRMFAAALLFGVASRLGAQQATTDTTKPAAQGYAPAAPVAASAAAVPEARAGTIVIPARSQAQLQEARAASEDDLHRADARLSRAKEIQSRSKGLVEQRRLDIREVEVKIEQAKKDKRDSDKRRLEGEKKELQRQKDWAEKLQAVDQGELEAARQASSAAFARQQSLDLEQQLIQARAGNGQASGGKPLSKENSDRLIRQLELQTLQSQLKYRQLIHELAKQEEGLARQRIELYKSAQQ